MWTWSTTKPSANNLSAEHLQNIKKTLLIITMKAQLRSYVVTLKMHVLVAKWTSNSQVNGKCLVLKMFQYTFHTNLKLLGKWIQLFPHQVI